MEFVACVWATLASVKLYIEIYIGFPLCNHDGQSTDWEVKVLLFFFLFFTLQADNDCSVVQWQFLVFI